MTFEEKAEIVINQLRADRDRLMGAIEKIRAEIANLTCDCINGMVNQYAVLQIIDRYAEQEPTTLQQIIEKYNMANLAYDEMSDFERDILKYAEQEPTSPFGPCDLCRFNPPSSADGKPCTMCPAEKGGE